MLNYLLFIVGFIFLIKGADFFVDGASALAKNLRISDLIIGLTIVAFGTSSPELVVNVYASLQGSNQIVIGNILGSNIINILVILGLASIIFPLQVTRDTVWKEIPFCVVATAFFGVLANDLFLSQQVVTDISRIDGILLLFLFVIFVVYIAHTMKKQRETYTEPPSSDVKRYGVATAILLMGIVCIGLNIGAKWVVDGAVELASFLGVSQSLIALTLVALGTSLPELVTSVMAAFKKNADIAIGNIVGSNIFNILLILGISSFVRPLQFNIGNNIDIFFAILAPLLLFVTMFTGRKKHLLERWEGLFFISLYAVYLMYVIVRG